MATLTNELGGGIRKRYTLPDGYSCKTFVMRELTAGDEIEAALMADAKGRPSSITAAITAERTESIRLALCEVDGNPVGGAEPFMMMDRWTYRTLAALRTAFDDINGVPDKDLENLTTKAEIVGAEGTTEARGKGVTT